MNYFELEMNYDKLLGIKTSGRDDSISNLDNYPYEPTDYCVLERLVSSGYILKRNKLIDYGCGKGRVSFFVNNQVKCHTIGIEYDERLYKKCLENKKDKYNKVNFINKLAEEYDLEDDIDRCFFFNPFSVDILKLVINKIIESYKRFNRVIYLFFYYPSDDYLAYLLSKDEIMMVDEIDCTDLFKNDKKERIMIFEII